ncbi:MAG: aromatic ring-hydroxylating dioxygenase subunit alpha [Ilumatobacter sp.]|nr:aromatic ring-hydroxylating dioxygenase subunit alpha [Ilumatobacter sp.]
MFAGDGVGDGLRDQWYVVADAADVATEPRAVTLLGARYVLWRTSGASGATAVVAAADRCPHRDGPLSGGEVTDGCIVCPYHGWTYGADGRCVLVPSAGPEAPVPSAARLALAAVRERYGLVWISPGEPAGEPPIIPQDGDPSYRRVTAGVELWRTSATRMTDNFCDVAHFPFVHAGTIGADTDPLVAGIEIEQLDDDFTGYRYVVDVRDERGEPVRQVMSTGFALPFTVRSNTTYETGPRTGHERVLLLCTTPVDDASSLFTFVVWRNHDHDLPAEELLAFDRAIGAEDKAMLEQIPGHLRLDPGATVDVRADRLSVRWRRMLSRLISPATDA